MNRIEMKVNIKFSSDQPQNPKNVSISFKYTMIYISRFYWHFARLIAKLHSGMSHLYKKRYQYGAIQYKLKTLVILNDIEN